MIREPEKCMCCGARLETPKEIELGYCHPCLNEAALEAGGD